MIVTEAMLLASEARIDEARVRYLVRRIREAQLVGGLRSTGEALPPEWADGVDIHDLDEELRRRDPPDADMLGGGR